MNHLCLEGQFNRFFINKPLPISQPSVWKRLENGEAALDKEETSHDDLFDAFRLSM